jgi:hypothetical protein
MFFPAMNLKHPKNTVSLIVKWCSFGPASGTRLGEQPSITHAIQQVTERDALGTTHSVFRAALALRQEREPRGTTEERDSCQFRGFLRLQCIPNKDYYQRTAMYCSQLSGGVSLWHLYAAEQQVVHPDIREGMSTSRKKICSSTEGPRSNHY